MKQIALEAVDLAKSYVADGVQTHVLGNINLKIYKGDFTSVMGPSGSGKSTLLYCLSGMDKPTAGDVLFCEKSIVRMKEQALANLRAQHFGFVFQAANLVSNLTLFENIAVPGYLKEGRTPKKTLEAVENLIERMGLHDVANHLPNQSSGGQQQRCAVARAVVNQPDIVFADEPTGALNRANSLEVLALLSEINATGQTIVMVTHDIRSAMRGNRILYLEDGDVRGEVNLPPWDAQHSNDISYTRDREAQANAWLSSLSW
ncbi:ABC transporter ATP-binding protein [Adlercreutzia sp. ZJ154]|uniref:ABC transporter ATP-binding protein n=1 Tax=Adlercreutzia sp. ZJ154 TaxID=2709790 RepID=UPI0013EB1089|nr:ABC transporter ATP-binding protein [Adlercreutzia sp. ZJ154]